MHGDEKYSPSHVDACDAARQDGEPEIYIDPVLERRTLRKFDYLVLPQMMILSIIGYMDRSNLGNARVFGLEEDLNLRGNQFGDISTVFYATYILFEMPWTICLKRYGVNVTLAIALVGWSGITLATGFIHNYTQAIVIRLLLGIFESGLSPCLAVAMSTIWDRDSVGWRISLLYVANALSGAFGGLIAYGIQSVGNMRGIAAWRWLYIIEGAVSMVLCGAAWFSMPKNAEEAWFLKPEEKEIMLARKALNARYKGPDKFHVKYIKMAVVDPLLWIGVLCSLSTSVGLFAYTTFLPTILRGLGHTGLEANYLSVPCYLFASFTSLVFTFASDRYKRRGIFAVITPIIAVIGYIIVLADSSENAGYAAMFFIAGGIYAYLSLFLTWVTNNLAPDYKRAAGLPLFIGIGNVGGIIGSNIYPPSDGPRYRTGLSISFAFMMVAWAGAGAFWFLVSKRDKKKSKMIAEGATDNGYEGDRALDFKYLH